MLPELKHQWAHWVEWRMKNEETAMTWNIFCKQQISIPQNMISYIYIYNKLTFNFEKKNLIFKSLFFREFQLFYLTKN